MASKRKYNIKGTKDFLVLAGIFFFLGLWAVKDAWYPSPGVLKKHPAEVVASFDTAGTVGQLHVAVGDSIGEGQVLVELRRSKLEMAFETTKKNYTASKNKHILMETALRNAEKNGATDEGIAELKEGVAQAQVALDTAFEKVGMARTALDSTELRALSKGMVKEILATTHTQVEAGEAVLLIDTKDHFYLFNKSLAIFSSIAFCVFLGLHILAH
jgi:multidrug resistance efflux pump